MTFTFSHLKRASRTLLSGMVLLLGASTVTYAQYYPGYGYGQSDDRHHERAEKHSLKHHQQDERYQYGNSRDLRDHQREERRQLKHEQRYERHTGERIHGAYGDQYDNSGYYRR